MKGWIPRIAVVVALLTAAFASSAAALAQSTVLTKPAGINSYPDTHSDKVTIVSYEQTEFWRNANREAGTITSLAGGVLTAKNTARVLYTGSDGGGVFRSLDGGDNSSPAHSVACLRMSVQSWPAISRRSQKAKSPISQLEVGLFALGGKPGRVQHARHDRKT